MNINGLKVFETIDKRQVEWGEESPHPCTQLSSLHFCMNRIHNVLHCDTRIFLFTFQIRLPD